VDQGLLDAGKRLIARADGKSPIHWGRRETSPSELASALLALRAPEEGRRRRHCPASASTNQPRTKGSSSLTLAPIVMAGDQESGRGA